MKALLARAELLARTQQRRVLERIAREVSERLPYAEVRVDGAQVSVSAKAIVRRWLLDPALRFLSAARR